MKLLSKRTVAYGTIIELFFDEYRTDQNVEITDGL